MPNRESLDDTLQRVGLACLMWHPAIAVDEPGYELVTDVDWCLEPVRDLVEDQRARLGEAIGRAIADPTGSRQYLFDVLLSLASDSE
ncbi:hypothetical protein GCM10027052_09080 [Parafrigoribacterium mesophilum]|uniref:hypothetical protein n=1 Tax=Parafrigoribacterium mesophilum TaxID=433646 RepID=UPI0031FBFC40